MIKHGAVVIPARYESSRFPGKPLADINGKTMIQHVYQKCVEAVGQDLVYVATDSDEIKNCVERFGGKVIMTSSLCLTGTDRIAEVNKILELDFIINVQGDEPMTEPDHVATVFKAMQEDTSCVLNCFCSISENEIEMSSVPKVVVSKSRRLIYMSRGGVPFDKEQHSHAKHKQICIYGFSRDHLRAFAEQSHKTENEECEDIEILRFLDMDIPVQMIQVSHGGIAVDTPEDLTRVKQALANNTQISN